MIHIKHLFLHAVALGALTLAFVGGTTPAAAQETLSFPARASDLALDSYWTVAEFSEGCCTLDLNVRRWNGSSWSGGSGNAENSQDYTWNVPIYAPANGEVVSCWRSFPDDPKPGVNPANNSIFTGGNHVVILTDEGNAVSINHLRSGSIPPSLCPSNPDGTQYPDTMTKQGDWRIAAYIEPADRPRVTEGQKVGHAGNSGNSGGPHLHMSIHSVSGTDGWGRENLAAQSSPLRFRHNWGHRFENDEQHTAAGWYRLRGGGFTGDPACASYQDNSPGCGFKTLHASPYLRRATASAGAIKGGDVLFLSSNRAVTATIAQNNSHLKLIGWDLVGVSTLNRKGDSEAGAAKAVALSEPTNDYVLAAVRQADDVLKMIAYHVAFNGTPLRRADRSAGKVSALDAATIGVNDKMTVTAVRDADGDLKVIVWDVEVANDGTASVVRLGSAQAGAVSAVAISRARSFNGVFTAVRDSEGNLKVIPWKISSDGQTVTRGDGASAGKIGTAIAVAPLAQGVAAAVRDSEGDLRVITWSASSSGDVGARRSTGVAGGISEVELLTAPHGDSNLTAVVRDSKGDLRLIGWAVEDDGTNLRRLGSSRAGAATEIAADVVSRSYPGKDPRDMVLTALRDADGDLKLITWDTNLVNP